MTSFENRGVKFLRCLCLWGTLLAAAPGALLAADDEVRQKVAAYQSKGYNVLFIAVDDLNDWVGCFGGNPQAITPHMDKLAKEKALSCIRPIVPPRSAARADRPS